MIKIRSAQLLLAGFVFAIATLSGCGKPPASLTDNGGGRKPSDFPEIADDVFKPMDGGIDLSPDEIKGRNTWNLWCAGDEQFWDRMAREGYGLMDLLKTIDSRNRPTRFKEIGLINQPGYTKAAKPDQYGLYIDEAVEPESKAIDPKVYGRPTGIMGFRLFDNPDFKGDAAKKWDGNKYYTDPDYAIDPKLVRPYRVGVSCGACHIAFNPCNPPADPENPKWENLASAIGNQYIREGRTFANNVSSNRFFWEMLKTQPPGTSDTSRIATDHINNPNTINAIFLLNERLRIGQEEEIAGDSLHLPGVTGKMKVPHVLKDGADSVGVPGATLRVYINIGSYSQHWLQQHNVLIGLAPQKPFSVATAQSNSVYWLATQQKFGNIAKFFGRLKSYRLEAAPGGADYITKDEAVMKRGKIVFAENCATCHSSKQPPAGVADEEAWFREQMLTTDFREDNFFSNDAINSVTKIKSNASRASGTNSKRGHIWDSFSSETYKKRPSVGSIEVWNPYTSQNEKFKMPEGGPGYYRTPSLISVWSSAPLLHNNALGKYTGDPSVKGRMEMFDDAITKLLWPAKRLDKESIWRTSEECHLEVRRAVLPWFLKPLCDLLTRKCILAGLVLLLGLVVFAIGKWRHTTQLQKLGRILALVALLFIVANFLVGRHVLRLGPIPKGTPVNLLANVSPDAGRWQLFKLAVKTKVILAWINLRQPSSEEIAQRMRQQLAPDLLRLSACPDLVEDRGHYFGTDLPDADKLALIELLKTL